MLRLAGRILAKSHSNKLAADTCTKMAKSTSGGAAAAVAVATAGRGGGGGVLAAATAATAAAAGGRPRPPPIPSRAAGVADAGAAPAWRGTPPCSDGHSRRVVGVVPLTDRADAATVASAAAANSPSARATPAEWLAPNSTTVAAAADNKTTAAVRPAGKALRLPQIGRAHV